MKTTLTPDAFITSCQRCRPTKHLHGWGTRELGAMVARLVQERDEAREECEALACVADARFAAAMRGEPTDRLDRGVSPEVVEREKAAVAWAIEHVGPTFAAMRAERDAARTLLRECVPLASNAFGHDALLARIQAHLKEG